jgi:tetratricopeptide (TPR) repeat protein
MLWVAVPAQGARKKAASNDDWEALEQNVADLQRNPGNEGLRIKIINLVLDMKRPPAVPQEAKKHMAYGTAALKGAKSEADFKEAVAEFQQAADAAPWWANAYYNLGIAQDKAGQPAAGVKSLKLYLLAAPQARDAEKVQQLVYEMEYRQKKGAQGFSPDTDFKAWLARLNGTRWLIFKDHVFGTKYFELNGDTLSECKYWHPGMDEETLQLNPGRRGTREKGWSYKLNKRSFVRAHFDWEESVEISEDGELITTKLIRNDSNPSSIGKVTKHYRMKD